MGETKFTEKQEKTLKKWIQGKPKVTLLSGGKRAGKTFLLLIMFLMSLEKLKNKNGRIAICGGSLSTIRRNIIEELEKLTGLNIKLGKSNEFKLFGQTIYCIGVGDNGAMKIARGFTGKLILINEVSEMADNVVKELQDRCSVEGGQILMDTNPTNRHSYIYKEIISKGKWLVDDDGKVLQMVEHFTMLDNTTLDKVFVNSQLMRYPKGTTDYLRHILGKYADAEGLVYPMFNDDKHIIDEMPRGIGVAKYFMGQDTGITHMGSLLVIAKLTDGRFIVVDGEIEGDRDTDFWVELLQKYNNQYHPTVTYIDPANAIVCNDYRKKTGMYIVNAMKKNHTVSGINYIKDLLKEGRLLFLKGSCPERLFEEFGAYVWDSKLDKPKDGNDDGLDGLRYGLYTEYKIIEEPNTEQFVPSRTSGFGRG